MKINLVVIITENLKTMNVFYRDVLNFKEMEVLDDYVEFEHEGVRFALSSTKVMHDATSHDSYTAKKSGQAVELAFKVDTETEVDTAYSTVVEKGAQPITPPATMPWGQRTAFFADPDGNIHEIFCDL